MFGKVWSIPQWAALGALLGALYQLLQAINQGLMTQGYAFVSGRVLGGIVVGTFAGSLVALLRNQMAGRR
jgi:hypothetical protein